MCESEKARFEVSARSLKLYLLVQPEVSFMERMNKITVIFCCLMSLSEENRKNDSENDHDARQEVLRSRVFVFLLRTVPACLLL